MLPAIATKARDLILLSPSPPSRLLLQQQSSALSELPLSGFHKNAFLSTCIPVSLVGGTAVLYKAVLDHPSSTSLSPLSLVLLVLLALQYAIQPQLSKRFISKKTLKTSLTLTEELIKSAMAIVGLLYTASSDGIMTMTTTWKFGESLRVAGLPAALYAVQGILQYTAYLHLDTVTYNGLSQTKVFSSALACALLLGQIPTRRQGAALVLLVASTLIFQGTWAVFQSNNKNKREQQQTSSNQDARSKASPTLQTNMSSSSSSSSSSSAWWFRGVVPCLGSTLLSGFAGALSQKGLQQTGGGRNAYLYTLEVSAYSAIAAYLLSTLRRWGGREETGGTVPNGTAESTAAADASNTSLFQYWTLGTLLPVACKALGGVLTALVHKHAGSVSKGFALTLGLVLSTGLMDQNELHLHQVFGTLLVMLSSWLHFSIPKWKGYAYANWATITRLPTSNRCLGRTRTEI